MIILDRPFVSDFLIKTIEKKNIPVLNTKDAHFLCDGACLPFVNEKEALAGILNGSVPRIYTNSENALNWISHNLGGSEISRRISIFKNKVLFRELLQKMYPGFFFRKVHLRDLDSLSIENIPVPFVIKPSIGFFSVGVYRVNDRSEWDGVRKEIMESTQEVIKGYPDSVLDTSTFIIEESIDGREFAVDAYFDENGRVCVLNILEHLFSSDTDVSDRVYYTSKKLVTTYLDDFSEFLQRIGDLSNVRNFPAHVELRIDDKNNIMPIEINPLRFGGWCTTADLAWHAFGFNAYELYLKGHEPEWKDILSGMDESFYSIVVLDNSTGLKADEISSFDYEKLCASFESPLDLRRIDYREYPVFGFLFAKTSGDNFHELKNILGSDLSEFVVPVTQLGS